MEIKYNLTGTDRKALVKAVSNIIGKKSMSADMKPRMMKMLIFQIQIKILKVKQ